MIKSMTGFAGTSYSENNISTTIEIRSYNSRYLDIVIRIPAQYGNLEDSIKQMISNRLTRGRVEIRITIKNEASPIGGFVVNEVLADAYMDALRQLKQRFDINDPTPLSLLSNVNGIIEPQVKELDVNAVWQTLQQGIAAALDEHEEMRKKEGAALAADLSDRIRKIEDCIIAIEQRTDGLLELYQKRLKERIHALTQGLVEIEPVRIAQEAACLADKCDISEEIVRARSHLQQFRDLMEAPEPSGKPLNFLLQEFSREFNTMGVKAGNAEISHITVTAKTELEKIREQVQNVE